MENKEQEQTPQEQHENAFDLNDYAYVKGDKVEVDAQVFMALIALLKEVEVEETRLSWLNTVPVAVKKGEIEWNPQPNPKEFFEQKPQMCLSRLGVAAFDSRYMLQLIHHNNALSGKAVKISELGNFETAKPGLKIA